MNTIVCLLLATLSIWDYPARQLQHDRLRGQFIEALRTGDTETMRETCEKGVKLLPDDPTWRYNLACSLAYYGNADKALDELERAIDLGFRDADAIAADRDLARIAKNPRFAELVEYARRMKDRPILTGPAASVDATGIFGKSVALGSQNLAWDFDLGCYVARLKLATASAGGNVGDLYMNRDGGHSMLVVTNYPGITPVTLDGDGRQRGQDVAFPNIRFPYPVFGNCSQALTEGPFWRSIPRALVTTEAMRLNMMTHFYLQNQIWVFPANVDYPPAGTHGDVFASVTPYWFTSAGISWSDQPILCAALEASRSLRRDVKDEIVRRGMLAPTIQMLVRKSLRGVENEDDYRSAKAHPTAINGNSIDRARLNKSAASLTVSAIPPLAVLSVRANEPTEAPLWPELTYSTGFAWAYVLRAADRIRSFEVTAKGSQEYAFAVVHDEQGAARLERLAPDSARLVIDRSLLSTTNRVDLAVFGRNPGTSWGAPSYVSVAVVDPKAAYSDPALTPQSPPPEIPAQPKQKSSPRTDPQPPKAK